MKVSNEMTTTKKYHIYGLIMAVLFVLELILPFDNPSLNIVFFGIAFLRIVLCRYMEHLYSNEIRRGNDCKNLRILFMVMTYFYLVVFIFDVQASFSFARSSENIMAAYKFLIFAWIFQFVLGAIVAYFYTNDDFIVRAGWIGINAVLIFMLLRAYGTSVEGTRFYLMKEDVILVLIPFRAVVWWFISLDRIRKEKKLAKASE